HSAKRPARCFMTIRRQRTKDGSVEKQWHQDLRGYSCRKLIIAPTDRGKNVPGFLLAAIIW
ncbi:MAG: hypothetical protein P8169_02110, partial [Chloroflexota bacterium]